VINIAFILNGFDNQERKLSFAKTHFPVLKYKFHACTMQQAFYPFHNKYLVVMATRKHCYKIFLFGFLLSNLHMYTQHNFSTLFIHCNLNKFITAIIFGKYYDRSRLLTTLSMLRSYTILVKTMHLTPQYHNLC